MMIPQGWLPHPSVAGWYYNPMNPSEMVQAQAPAPAPQPMAYPAASAPTQDASYGAVDTSMYAKPMPSSYGKREDYIYLDFPDRSLSPGESVSITLRLLPPWAPTEKMASIFRQQHTLPAKYHPRTVKTRFFMPDCYNTEGGPGNCPICRVLEALATGSSDEDASTLVKDAKVRTSSIWQGYDVENIAQHCIQDKDAQGNVLGWHIKPGLFTASPKIYAGLSQLMLKGDFTSPDAGANIIVTKRKTGPDRMNVDYAVMPTMEGRSAIPNEYRSILSNLINLRETYSFYERAEMDAIAAKIAEEFHISFGDSAPVAGAGWLPHPANPQYEYNPTTGQTRLITAPPVPQIPSVPQAPPVPQPAPVPMAPPSMPMAAPPAHMPPMQPPMPMAAPAQPPMSMPSMPGFSPPTPPPMPVPAAPPMAMPPPPPTGGFAPPPAVAMPPVMGDRPLPPPGAPGGLLAAPPAIPMGAAPTLGMPGALPALPGMPGMPPPPPGVPGAAMSPGALEAALAGSPGKPIPF